MRVAVAGGGIAGLTAATALSARGFSVDVYERAAALTEIGAGIQLSPNAMAVLERLGVTQFLKGQCCEPEALLVRNATSGATLMRMPLGKTARARYGAPYCTLHRADLQAALLAAAERTAGIHLGAELRDVHQTESDISFVAAGERRAAAILIGADGVHSTLRTGLFRHSGARPYGRAAWRATLTADAARGLADTEIVGLWLGDRAHLVHYPIRAGALMNVVVVARGEGPLPPLFRFGPTIRPLLERVAEWTPWPLLHVDAGPRWCLGRAVLIGDAAHAMAPSAAQGGAQAIEDAWVLARALEHTTDIPRALARFEQARRPRVARVVAAADRNVNAYEAGGVPGVIRNILLSSLPGGLFLSRFDWLFGWKPE
jgi:salicylate hydroxylase